MKRRLVLFDIDGTLLLSGGAGRRAILRALGDEIGRAARAAERVRFDGKTDPEIVVELLEAAGQAEPRAPDRIARILDRYVVHLEADLVEHGHRSTVMPGVLALLTALETDRSMVMGLLTGNVSRGAALKLKAAAIEPARFLVGAYGSDHAIRAELPAIAVARAIPIFGRAPFGEEIVIIGDTPADVSCGRGIGARAIAVATGSYTVEDLTRAGPCHVFVDLADTARVLETIAGEL